jgi:muramoyltetrapeptide carboxypeptidase
MGGNLASIEGLLGTPWAPEWKNSILFWEDIGKPVNRLDMTLTHFRDAGVFDGISGMIIGELVNCAPPEGGQTLEEMLHEVIGDFSFPVLTHVDLGHTDDKITLPIGVEAELDSERGTFSLLETGVR